MTFRLFIVFPLILSVAAQLDFILRDDNSDQILKPETNKDDLDYIQLNQFGAFDLEDEAGNEESNFDGENPEGSLQTWWQANDEVINDPVIEPEDPKNLFIYSDDSKIRDGDGDNVKQIHEYQYIYPVINYQDDYSMPAPDVDPIYDEKVIEDYGLLNEDNLHLIQLDDVNEVLKELFKIPEPEPEINTGEWINKMPSRVDAFKDINNNFGPNLPLQNIDYEVLPDLVINLEPIKWASLEQLPKRDDDRLAKLLQGPEKSSNPIVYVEQFVVYGRPQKVKQAIIIDDEGQLQYLQTDFDFYSKKEYLPLGFVGPFLMIIGIFLICLTIYMGITLISKAPSKKIKVNFTPNPDYEKLPSEDI